MSRRAVPGCADAHLSGAPPLPTTVGALALPAEVGVTESMNPLDGDRLVEAMRLAVDQLGGRPWETDRALAAIVRAAVDSVPGADQAGISLCQRDGDVVSQVPTSDVVRLADHLQSELREGPCMTAVWEEQSVLVDDLAAETSRWPRFAVRAVELGVASMVSYRLFVMDQTLGALNLYSGTAGSFDHESRTIAALFASYAAIALDSAQDADNLRRALSTRQTIGQASGILMERYGIGPDEAFTMLVRTSQHANIKVVDLARWLVTEPTPRRHP
jgi:GAF domain-containing protein